MVSPQSLCDKSRMITRGQVIVHRAVEEGAAGLNHALSSFTPYLFGRPREDVVNGLDALHHRMIHIADLVLPRAETSARINVARHQKGLDARECGISFQGWDGIGILRFRDIARDDAFPVCLLDQSAVDQ